MTMIGQLPPIPVPGRDHVQGHPSAGVTLLEYGDFECPYCGAAHEVVKAVQDAMDDRLAFAFRHFPLTQIHPHAQMAAEAAEAAGAQGRFWEMHDVLFENQRALNEQAIVAYAAGIGLDVDRFVQELNDGVHVARVREDFMSGVRNGVNGTPTFFINGQRHAGVTDFPTLLAAIERAETLAAAGRP